MKIFGWELKKILSDRALWILLAACMAVQAALLCSPLDQRSQLDWWNDLAGHTGTAITAESLEKLENYAKTERELIQSGKNPAWAEHSYQAAVQLDQLDAVREEAGVNAVTKQDFSPDLLVPASADSAKQAPIETYRDDAIRARITQANRTQEANFFSAGSFFPARESLFSMTFLFFYLEMILAAVYLSARSASLEFSDGTQQLVYTCRRGRKLQRSKLAACLIAVTGIYLICAAFFAAAYLLLYPQWNFLAVPYSADPFAAGLIRFPVSFLGYMLLHLALGYLIILVLTLLIFGLTSWGRSPMIVIAIFLTGGTAMMMTGRITNPALAPVAVNSASLLISMDPVIHDVTLNTASWFCYTGRPLDLPYIEWIAVLLWGNRRRPAVRGHDSQIQKKGGCLNGGLFYRN